MRLVGDHGPHTTGMRMQTLWMKMKVSRCVCVPTQSGNCFGPVIMCFTPFLVTGRWKRWEKVVGIYIGNVTISWIKYTYTNAWTTQSMKDKLLFKAQRAKIICSSMISASTNSEARPAEVHEETNSGTFRMTWINSLPGWAGWNCRPERSKC